MPQVYEAFINEVIAPGDIQVIRLESSKLVQVAYQSVDGILDFDDAYQHIAAKYYGLTLASFDTDFDKIPQGRITPYQVVKIKKDS